MEMHRIGSLLLVITCFLQLETSLACGAEAAALPPGSVERQLPQLDGVVYVTVASPHVAGIYLVDPTVVRIGDYSFLTGREAGRRDGTSGTNFSGGITYIDLARVILIQQVPEARDTSAPARPGAGTGEAKKFKATNGSNDG